MQNEIQAYIDHLLSTFDNSPHWKTHERTFTFEARETPKFIRIERIGIKGHSDRSIHSFIVLNDDDIKTKKGVAFKRGDILKAAGWNAPAKNFKRGNILEKKYGGTYWAGA